MSIVVKVIMKRVVNLIMNINNLLLVNWVCNLNVNVCGSVVIILIVINKEILLLIFLFVICLFSYIENIVLDDRIMMLEN